MKVNPIKVILAAVKHFFENVTEYFKIVLPPTIISVFLQLFITETTNTSLITICSLMIYAVSLLMIVNLHRFYILKCAT